MLSKYIIKPIVGFKNYTVVAEDAESAWDKFCGQQWEVLSPNPADYDVQYIGTVDSPTS